MVAQGQRGVQQAGRQILSCVVNVGARFFQAVENINDVLAVQALKLRFHKRSRVYAVLELNGMPLIHHDAHDDPHDLVHLFPSVFLGQRLIADSLLDFILEFSNCFISHNFQAF